MPFSANDISAGMDVYTLDNVYLGSVLAVRSGPLAAAAERVAADARQSGATSGELLGPMPTQTIGNPGPRSQSAGALYGTQPGSASSLGRGAIEVGRRWGMADRREIPLDAVQTVSQERVMLRLTWGELSR